MAPSRCPAPSPHPVAAATARRRGPGAAAAALARRVSSMRLRRRGPRALLPRRSPSSSPRGDLPRPRSSSNSGVAGGAGSSAASVAAGSQPMSQQSFSQGVVGSGGASSLLHSQSQLSQASLDENLLSLHLASPTRDQRFGLHDDSSKKMPSLPVSSASCVREESQLQLAKTSSNLVHRWNPSLPDGRCVVPTEDVERKFQHMASSVHKVGMVLDSVQNDVVQEIVGAVRSLNSKIDAIQMPTDQRCTTNGRPLMNLLPVDRNERPQVNQTPEVPRTEMEAMMDDLLEMGEPRSASVHVVSSVLSQNSSHSSHQFLKNVGIKTPVSNKSATPNENDLREQLEAEARAAVQGELEELKKKSEDADQRLLKTQNELEEYKKMTEQNIKKMEENRILIRQLLRIHGPSSSGPPST